MVRFVNKACVEPLVTEKYANKSPAEWVQQYVRYKLQVIRKASN